jgi:hypothetical protein
MSSAKNANATPAQKQSIMLARQKILQEDLQNLEKQIYDQGAFSLRGAATHNKNAHVLPDNTAVPSPVHSPATTHIRHSQAHSQHSCNSKPRI